MDACSGIGDMTCIVDSSTGGALLFGNNPREIRAPDRRYLRCAFSPDGSLLLLSTHDGQVDIRSTAPTSNDNPKWLTPPPADTVVAMQWSPAGEKRGIEARPCLALLCQVSFTLFMYHVLSYMFCMIIEWCARVASITE